jgi:hypothetical protein
VQTDHRTPPRRRVDEVLRWAIGIGLVAVLSCSPRNERLSDDGAPAEDVFADDCREEGCPCLEEGQVQDCGRTKTASQDRVVCDRGERTCRADGTWSECVYDRTTVISAPDPTDSSPAALGSFGKCPDGFDPCDAYCHITADSAGGFSAGPGFKNQTSGLTLDGTVKINCTSLTLTPSTSTVTLSGSSMTTLSAPPVTFTLTAGPSGCVGSSFPTTWLVDQFDRASISGTNNSNGSLTVAVPIAGTIKVTALAAGLSASTNVAVKVNVLEVPSSNALASPNQAAPAGRATVFGTLTSPAAGSGASTASWLYPYAGTYFPLALPPPVIQYLYTRSTGDSTTTASAVKVSLRYPAGSTAAAALFNYSLVVNERNTVTCAAKPSECNFLDPQLSLPKEAWRFFELSARGADATLVVQRLRERSSGSPTLELETTRNIHFVDGQLKGTVIYHSYSSPQAGNTGAVLSIQPGATTPELAISPSGTCVTCHSVNSTGSQVIANGGVSGGSYSFSVSKAYNMSTPSPSPSSTAVFADNKFTWGAPWLDGVLYMSHGGGVEWHSPTLSNSGFYKVSSPALAQSVTNWPSNAQAYFPRFSPDGTKLGFTYISGSDLPCSSSAVSPCSGSPRKVGPVSGMTRLVVTDFSCSSPPCTSSSTGFSVSNARDITPGVTDRVSRPTFSPQNKIVAYQRQTRSAKGILSWAASDVGSIGGAQAEIWGSVLPANGSTAAVPTRLNALNGLTSGGSTYLPSRARTLVEDTRPLYDFRIARHEMSQSGGSGPAITLLGEPTGVWNIKIDIVTGGSRGTSTFRYSTDGGSSYSLTPSTTASSVSLGSTGLKAQFPSGTYSNSSIYSIRTGNVRIKGTPTATGNQDVRIKIDTTGNRGTAKFKYSTDGGSSYSSSALTTAASVSLGTTGLIAEFDSVNYESTSWAWGALVAHPHQDNASYTLVQADACENNATMPSARDTATNFFPSFAPSLVGDMAFLVFSSRRMYGNVAVQDGWDPEPVEHCSSGGIPSKKLWISAVDPDAAAGTDGSRPAFYLPGQEIAAGNSDGYWIGAACTAVDGACETDEDCCGGTGSGAANQCRVLNASIFPPTKACKARSSCASTGQSCSTGADCCTGLLCPTGGGLCYQEPPLLFEVQTTTRTYVADCASGTLPAWRFFEWQATIPTGTAIEVYSQTRESSSEAWDPGSPLLVATMSSTTASGQWFRGSLPTSSVFKNAGVGNYKELLVTLKFIPNSSGTLAPTLHNWRQIVDCVPGE